MRILFLTLLVTVLSSCRLHKNCYSEPLVVHDTLRITAPEKVGESLLQPGLFYEDSNIVLTAVDTVYKDVQTTLIKWKIKPMYIDTIVTKYIYLPAPSRKEVKTKLLNAKTELALARHKNMWWVFLFVILFIIALYIFIKKK